MFLLFEFIDLMAFGVGWCWLLSWFVAGSVFPSEGITPNFTRGMNQTWFSQWCEPWCFSVSSGFAEVNSRIRKPFNMLHSSNTVLYTSSKEVQSADCQWLFLTAASTIQLHLLEGCLVGTTKIPLPTERESLDIAPWNRLMFFFLLPENTEVVVATLRFH